MVATKGPLQVAPGPGLEVGQRWGGGDDIRGASASPPPPTSSSSPFLFWGKLGEWRGWVEAGLFVFLLSQEVVEMSQG